MFCIASLAHLSTSRVLQRFKLEQIKGDCSGLYGACLRATIESCQLVVLLRECVMEGVSNTCCSSSERDHLVSEQSVRRSKRDRDRAPVAEVTVSKESVPSMDESEDFSLDKSDYGRENPSGHKNGYDFIEKGSVVPKAHRALKVQDTRNDLKSAVPDSVAPRGNWVQDTSPADYINPERVPAWSTPALVERTGPSGWSSKFEPKYADETLLGDVDRFVIAMQPIKECQQQLRDLRYDNLRSKEAIAREAWFWRQHEARWKTRLPFHGADITYNADDHFS